MPRGSLSAASTTNEKFEGRKLLLIFNKLISKYSYVHESCIFNKTNKVFPICSYITTSRKFSTVPQMLKTFLFCQLYELCTCNVQFKFKLLAILSPQLGKPLGCVLSYGTIWSFSENAKSRSFCDFCIIFPC